MQALDIPEKIYKLAEKKNPEIIKISDDKFKCVGDNTYFLSLVEEDLHCNCLAGQHNRACYHAAATVLAIIGKREFNADKSERERIAEAYKIPESNVKFGEKNATPLDEMNDSYLVVSRPQPHVKIIDGWML